MIKNFEKKTSEQVTNVMENKIALKLENIYNGNLSKLTWVFTGGTKVVMFSRFYDIHLL